MSYSKQRLLPTKLKPDMSKNPSPDEVKQNLAKNLARARELLLEKQTMSDAAGITRLEKMIQNITQTIERL